MAKGSLRRYDVQAKVSIYFAIVALLGAVALAVLIYLRFDFPTGTVFYGSTSIYAPVVYIVTTCTLLLAATGTAIGANSAGQKRNQLTRRSWIAFFVGAASLSSTIILFSIFWFYKFPIAVQQ